MNSPNENKGFITLPILGVIIITTIFTGGLGYVVYTQQNIIKENRELREVLQNTEVSQSDTTNKNEIEVVVELSDAEEELEEIVTPQKSSQTQSSPVTITTSPKPIIITKENPAAENKPIEVAETPTKLTIEKVVAKATKTSVTITWQTSIPSDSRLLIHRGGSNNIFPSNNSNSKSHTVIITGLDSSRNYTYEIIATTDGTEVSKYEKFYTEREFIMGYKETTSDNCFIYFIEDTAKNPLINTSLDIIGSGNLYSENNTIYPRATTKTNIEGEFKYCNPADKLKVINSNTGEIYYDNR